LPIGTLYDPFIARGLDALNYACYQDARFILVATPSGMTLAPEGGAHQSIGTPLIGIGQPGLTYMEPAFGDELVIMMRWALSHVQGADGGGVYLRLSTRSIVQPAREMSADLEAAVLAGGYWLQPPAPEAELAIVASGTVLPEAMEALEQVREDIPGAGLRVVTSPDRLYRDWRQGQERSHARRLITSLADDARLVTILDGHPATLSWLGSVRGQRVWPLGVERFGQSADIPDLYRAQGLDADSIVTACARAFLAN
jgi:pyruvate dehydrogenase E1 component